VRARARLDAPVRELARRLEALAILAGALTSLGRAEASALEAIEEASERFEQTGVLVPVARAPREGAAPEPAGAPERAQDRAQDRAHPVEQG
jgi:hypothetical protein